MPAQPLPYGIATNAKRDGKARLPVVTIEEGATTSERISAAVLLSGLVIVTPP
jgi:hypothetical protein